VRKSRGILRCFTRWALLECDDAIGATYRSLYSLEYFYRQKIQRPLWGSHITIIRGEISLCEKIKKELHEMEIEYYYVPSMATNGCHFYLPVICPILDDIRQTFGLGKSPVNYHLSVGNLKHDISISNFDF
jgi:hypothetical protein